MDTARGWRKVAAFGVLTALIAAPLQFLVIRHGMPAPIGLVFAFMWSPAAAALLTRILFGEGLRGLGWGAGRWRYWALGYVLPLAYAVPVYAVVWLSGLGGFPDAEFLAQHAGAGASDHEVLLRLFVATATVHVLVALPFSLGEEIGWRGFLVPELARLVGFAPAAAIIGVVWAAWHAPIIALTSYNGGAPLAFTLTCYTGTCIGVSFVLAWLRLRSGSLWPAVLLHTTHNAFIAELFTPLTTPTAATPWLLDEWGIGLPVTTGIAAVLAWRAWRATPSASAG